jgi:hypothetical protein
MTARGVFASARKPLTMSAGRSWPPASFMVGTSRSTEASLLLKSVTSPESGSSS